MTEREKERILGDRHSHLPHCFHCKHLIHAGDQAGFGWTCKAYDEEIPPAVVNGEVKHTEVLSTQEGEYIYEPKVFTDPLGSYTLDVNGIATEV